MKPSTGRLMNDFFEEFKNIDEFRNRFKNDFYETFCCSLTNLYQLKITKPVKEYIIHMAEETLGFTEAIFEKDQNYPEYRKDEEISLFTALIEKQNTEQFPLKEIQEIKHELSSLILKNYPAIFNLTAFGYRLLEKYLQFHTFQFISGIRYEINSQHWARP